MTRNRLPLSPEGGLQPNAARFSKTGQKPWGRTPVLQRVSRPASVQLPETKEAGRGRPAQLWRAAPFRLSAFGRTSGIGLQPARDFSPAQCAEHGSSPARAEARPPRRTPRLACLALLLVVPAAAQDAPPDAALSSDQTRLSLSLYDEGSFAAGLRVPGPWATNLLLVQPSFSWRHAQRWRLAASLAAIGSTGPDTHGQLRVREAWGGVTAGDFDFSLGKKILRWGTGYAFTPTGVLDPPRNPIDPTDRLSLNEGREMVAADWVSGRHALTAVWASAGVLGSRRTGMTDTAALRYNTMIAGFDSAVIFAHDPRRPDFYGANFTRVVGEALEVHGEFAHREGNAVLLGGKYMLRSGVNTIFEWYSPQAPRLGRYMFLSVGKSRLRELPGWKQWDVSLALVANTTDRSRMLILDVTRRVADHFSLTAHAPTPGGKRWRSEYGMIPYSALVSIGFRYQI